MVPDKTLGWFCVTSKGVVPQYH